MWAQSVPTSSSDTLYLHQIRGISNGLLYLHSSSPPVVHGDIHPVRSLRSLLEHPLSDLSEQGNLVINEQGLLQICDFGRSRIVASGAMGSSGPGRLRFLAPEADMGYEAFNPTHPSDVYSFALTIFALGARTKPFEGLGELAAAKAALLGERPARPASLGPLSPSSTEALWRLMTDMWHPDPAFRPTALMVRDCLSLLL